MNTAVTLGAGATAPLHPISFRNEWNPDQIDDSIINLTESSKLGLPQLPLVPEHDRLCVIVCAAPSIAGHLDRIRELSKQDVLLFGINSAYPYLVDHGIIPNAYICFEVAPDQYVTTIEADPSTTFYMSSMCDPSQYKKLVNQKRIVWHPWSDLPVHVETMERVYPRAMLIGGGCTSVLRAIPVASALGYRRFELFGFECSFDKERTHIHGTPDYAKRGWCNITAKATTGETREFLSNGSLVRQADEFRELSKNYAHMFNFKLHGNGLAPFIHRTMFPTQYEEEK